jgi:hypothetical protein
MMPRTLEERLWSRVEKQPGGCWLWQAATRAGYPAIWFEGRHVGAHRLVYELYVGPIGDACVCHRCDVKRCVNPAHLFLGSHADNARDRDTKGRGARGEQHPAAKLATWQVRLAFEMADHGASLSQIARRFGVTKQTAWRVVRGAAWKYVPRTEEVQ